MAYDPFTRRWTGGHTSIINTVPLPAGKTKQEFVAEAQQRGLAFFRDHAERLSLVCSEEDYWGEEIYEGWRFLVRYALNLDQNEQNLGIELLTESWVELLVKNRDFYCEQPICEDFYCLMPVEGIEEIGILWPGEDEEEIFKFCPRQGGDAQQRHMTSVDQLVEFICDHAVSS